MSLSSAKAKLDAQGGDPATGYISKQDHKDSYTELLDDTALTGDTTAEALDVTGALTAGTVSSDATVSGTGLAGSLLSSANPVMDSVAAPGTSVIPSRQDHVHPSDATRVALPSVAVGVRVDLAGAYSGLPAYAPASQGQVYIVPVYSPVAMTISRVSIRVLSAPAAGAVWRLGFWSLDGTGGTPYTLLGDCGTLDPTTIGIKSITGLSLALPVGRLAFGVALQGSGAGGGSSYGATQMTLTDTGSGTRYDPSHTGWLATGITGALPSTITASIAGLSTCTPHVVVQRSA